MEAVSAAIDNEQIKAQLRAELLDARASLVRVVEAADADRRRVERNLHDGAQQRLVGIALTLRLANREAHDNPVLTELLADAVAELDDALGELRRLARGLHPAIVTDAGLVVALETLAERPGLPVDLSLDLPSRLPDHVEIAAYYLVAEALANTNKHAAARHVAARADVVDDALRVSVSDDGRGGAAGTPGSGLQGLADRVRRARGNLVVDSVVGKGTTVTADIPLRLQSGLDRGLRSRTALKWIGWENWEAPAVLYDQIVEEDLLTGAKAILLCAGGNKAITTTERDWLIGYLTAAGDSDGILEAVRTYDDSDRLEDLMSLPSMSMIGRGMLYEGVRLCASDGLPTHVELDRLRDSADRIGISHDFLDELHKVVLAEHKLRRRRYELMTAPMFQGNLTPGSSNTATR